MKLILGTVLCLLMIEYSATAQNITSGHVLDALTKEPLVGVTVRLKSTKTGTVTGSDGSYTLPVAEMTDTLLFSYIGYTTETFPVTNATERILLRPASNQLNQVVVSASREAQLRTDAPIAISAISREVMLETKPTSFEQVLNKISGVYMVNLGNEQHTMAIRQPIGYKSLFLYLEDGIPIRATGNFNHNALIEMNMAAIKNIEILRGPSSSLYGSEAIGGAVNFITQAPSQILTGKLQVEASDKGYRRTDFSISNTVGKLGVFVAGYYAAQRDGIIEHSDFDKLALSLRTDYTFTGKTKLVTTVNLIDYNTDQTGGLDSENFYAKNYSSQHTFTYRKVNAFRFRSTLEHDWNALNSTRFTLFFRNNSINQNPFYAIKSVADDPLKAKGEINKDAFQSYGLIAQHRKLFPFMNAQFISVLSLDYSPATYEALLIDIDKSEKGRYTGYTETDQLLTDYDVNLLNTAAYAQVEINPLERLKGVAALRYDIMGFHFDNHLKPGAYTGAPDEMNNFKSLTPKMGLTYDLGNGIGLYTNYSVGFTPPQISELYRGVQVPRLLPANYKSYEAGGWLSFAHNKGYIDLNVYQLNGTNEIVSVRLNDGSYENQNAGETRHRGVEYTLKYAPVDNLNFRFSGTSAVHTYMNYVERGNNFNGNEMATAPRFIGNMEASYKPFFAKGLRLSLEWQHIGNYYMDAANTESYPGYNLLNARAGYTFMRMEIWLNLLNVTNELYATTADKYIYGKSYRLGSPRTLHAGVGYNLSARNK